MDALVEGLSGSFEGIGVEYDVVNDTIQIQLAVAGGPSEALGIIAKLTSGYHRDLQLLKVPVFRGIDLAIATTDLLPVALILMGIESVRVVYEASAGIFTRLR